MSILVVGSMPSDEIKYLLDWLNQSNYLAINMLTVDKSFCKYQIPSLSDKGCSSITSTPSIFNTFEFYVGMAAGGAALTLCSFNIILFGLKLSRRRKEK